MIGSWKDPSICVQGVIRQKKINMSSEIWSKYSAQLVALYVLGGVIASSPGLFILFADPEAFYVQFLGLRSQWAAKNVLAEEAIWTQFLSLVMHRLIVIKNFFFSMKLHLVQ